MTSAAIETAFRRNSPKGKMSIEGFVQALEELNQLNPTPYAFNIGDKVKGLTVEEYHNDKTFGTVYTVRDTSGSAFEIGETELLTLKNNKR